MKTGSSIAAPIGALLTILSSVCAAYDPAEGYQEPLGADIDPTKYKAACPDYKNYAMRQQYVNTSIYSIQGEY
jgi:hypothetical protein